jgi:ubiquitin-conjugating enzyme E2 variant
MLIVVACAQVLGALLLVDLLSGVLHWLEDSYGTEETPLLGPYVIRPNIIHHADPLAFTKSPVWRRNRVVAVIVALLLGTVWWSGHFSWFWAWLGLFGLLSNEIHVWAHRSRRQNGPVIVLLQRLRLVQSPRHHAVHHRDPKRDHFCAMTNLLNPILDRIRFFRALEWLIARLTGVTPRPDPTVKTQDWGRPSARARS